MPSTTSSFIYIGNLVDLDPDESDYFTDNSGAAAGTYDRTVLKDVTVIQNDDDGNRQIENDDAGQAADSFTYDLGAGSVTSNLDNEARYDATYVDENGVSHATTISIYQTVNGDTFAKLPGGVLVQSLTINGMVADGYASITYGTSSTAKVACFVAGTRIRTARGGRPIETLVAGDMIATRDHGPQPLHWIGSQQVVAKGDMAPIEIAAGVLGNKKSIRVSPQHRILVSHPQLDLHFGRAEALIPAFALVDGRGIRRVSGGVVTYYHLLFERHELLWSEGMWSESLYPGDEAFAGFSPEQRGEILMARDLGAGEAMDPGTMAAFSPVGREARAMGRQMARNAFAP